MGDTPRTDAFYWRATGANPIGRSATEWAEFARDIEARARRNGRRAWGIRRELAEARDAISIDTSTEMNLRWQLADARRQVRVLSRIAARGLRCDSCGVRGYCQSHGSGNCVDRLRAWAAQAKEGGGK
jgi:hypothetical protein